jgi:hypothetical protein
MINDDNATQTFKSLEVAAFRRFSNNWQFLASYTATKRNVPVSPILVGNVVQNSATQEFASNTLVGDFNPNAEINTSDRNWESDGKLSGAYALPLAITFSASYEHRGGYPWARQVLYTGGQPIASILVNVEPIGTRRLPSTNQLDIRFEKSFKLAKGQKVSARLNIFNALNENSVLDFVRQSGSKFMLPTSIMPPRIMEVSASYTF